MLVSVSEVSYVPCELSFPTLLWRYIVALIVPLIEKGLFLSMHWALLISYNGSCFELQSVNKPRCTDILERVQCKCLTGICSPSYVPDSRRRALGCENSSSVASDNRNKNSSIEIKYLAPVARTFSYLGDHGLKTRSRGQFSWLRCFVAFLRPFKQSSGVSS